MYPSVTRGNDLLEEQDSQTDVRLLTKSFHSTLLFWEAARCVSSKSTDFNFEGA